MVEIIENANNAVPVTILTGFLGAGKTTLLQLVVGQLLPQDGRVCVLGRDAVDPILRDQIGRQVIVKISEGEGVFQWGGSWPVCRCDTLGACFNQEVAF